MPDAETYDEAMTAVSVFVLSQFNDAIKDVQYLSSLASLNEEQEKDLKVAQGTMAAALAQLSNVETQRSQQRGRTGYATVVEFLNTAAATATAVCDEIRNLVPFPPGLNTEQQQLRNERLETLTSLLEAMADLSPASTWMKPPAAGGLNG